MSLFFAFESELADGVGFSHFDAFHLSWLAAVLLVCLLAVRYVPRWKPSVRGTAGRLATAAMAGSELMRMILLQSGGHWSRAVLPLHLCSLAVWLCLLHAWRAWTWTGNTLYALCLPGACAALLFPDWVMYPPVNYFCLHSFALHGATVLYIVAQTAAGEISPRKAAWRQPAAFLCAVVPVIAWVDWELDVNYFFLRGSTAGSPLAPLQAALGYPGYLLGYTAAVLLVMWGMLAAAETIQLRDFAQKKQKKNRGNR